MFFIFVTFEVNTHLVYFDAPTDRPNKFHTLHALFALVILHMFTNRDAQFDYDTHAHICLVRCFFYLIETKLTRSQSIKESNRNVLCMGVCVQCTIHNGFLITRYFVGCVCAACCSELMGLTV